MSTTRRTIVIVVCLALLVAVIGFAVFGREGYALPLGRAVQHTGEIDAANPLEMLWVFGKPAQSMDGFAQAKIEADGDGGFLLRAAPSIQVQVFGDPGAVVIEPM